MSIRRLLGKTGTTQCHRLHEPDQALHIEDLTVAYEGKPVLWDIDVNIPPGVMAAIIGPQWCRQEHPDKDSPGPGPPDGRPYLHTRSSAGRITATDCLRATAFRR